MSDNPFDEPDDQDRTIIRGPQRRPDATRIAPGPAASTPAPETALPGAAEDLPRLGLTPLGRAAAPLIDLLARLAITSHVERPDALHERAEQAVRDFDAAARQEDVPQEQVQAARYGLCAAIDDVALAAPWSAGSTWSSRSLVSTFHQEVRSGERFFAVLDAMQKEPGRYRQALEIFYLCLALGMQGQFRLIQGGSARLDALREGLYRLLTELRGRAESELSPHWRGVDAPLRPAGRTIPAWTALPATLAVLGILYAALAYRLASGSDGLFAQLATLGPQAPVTIARAMPVIPPAPVPHAGPTLVERLRSFLAPEITAGQVTVTGDMQQALIRIAGAGIFASGATTLDPRFTPLLDRIGAALARETGPVRVIGHSDNQPIRTLRFPSNFALSEARAQSAASQIASAAGGNPARFTVEGRGDSEPVASNATEEGREQNRRIEVAVSDGARAP